MKRVPIGNSPSSPAAGLNETRWRLRVIANIFLVFFLALGFAAVFWSVIQAPVILARDDNPRLVEAELQLQRGRILDVNGFVLAESVGMPEDYVRKYATSSSGPAVGYYSFRHGTAGIEEGFDELLRGATASYWENFWQQEILHKSPKGRDLRLTLNATWQRAAGALLGDDRGAVILMSVPDSEIRVMVSHPEFDPNKLDEQFDELVADKEAPLLNRATQGLYQPGLALQPFILAAAFEGDETDIDSQLIGATDPVPVDGAQLQCVLEDVTVTDWADAIQYNCPAPFADLAYQVGASRLMEIYDQLGFLDVPEVPMAAEATDIAAVENTSLAGIGQDTLTVSPLQMSMALIALATDGELKQPKLVLEVQSEDGQWLPAPMIAGPAVAVAPQVARTVRNMLPEYKGLKEHAAMALTGPGGNANAWYLGIAPVSDPRFAVVVVVEDAADTSRAEQIGRTLLNLSLGRKQLN